LECNGSKVEKKFMPVDYVLNLLRRIQNLKQVKMTMKEFTKECHRLSTRANKTGESPESIAKYVCGLRYAIQYEFDVLNFCLVVESCQTALRIEEKLQRKQ
jgi:hypothetical protein